MKAKLLLLLLWVAPCFADSTWYVDPDATGTPIDGTTWGQAYRSLNAAESAKDGSLSGAGVVYFKLRASSGTADTTTVDFGGWTNADSSNYVYVLMDGSDGTDQHAGVFSTSIYRLQTAATWSTAIAIGTNYTRFSGLQYKETGTGSTEYPFGMYISATNVTIDHCIIWRDGTSNQGQAIAGVGSGTLAPAFIYNNIIYDDWAYAWYSGYNQAEGTFYNNTVYQTGGSGFQFQNTQSPIVKNNIIECNGGTCFLNSSGTPGTGSGYNMSDDATADDASISDVGNDVISASNTFTSTTEDSENLHLVSGSALDGGDSSVGGLFTDDIDWVTRSGTWNIGADEDVPAGGASAKFIMVS